MSKYAAVDLGASSGRVILGEFAAGGLTLTEIHRFDNGPAKTGESLFWDIQQLFKEIKIGLKKAVSGHGGLAGIAIDTWGVDYALLGDKGFVRPPYHYRDSRVEEIPDQVFAKIPQETLYRRTGIQFMALNTLYQLVAHQQAHPDDLRGTTMLMMPDALTYLLSGARTVEYTEASTSQLVDPVTREWNYPLIEDLGLPRTIFPALVKPCSKAGTLREELCRELGCGPVPVFKVGAHDTASAVAAVPAETGSGDWAYLSCGTWSLLGAEIDRPIVTEAARAAGFTNEGGLNGKIRFLTNIDGLWLLQECRRIWNENGKAYTYPELEKMAREAKPRQFLVNPNNPRFFAPKDMPAEIRAYCAETGQRQLTDDSATVRCVMDSLAARYRASLDILAGLLGKKFARLHVVGGGCRNALLTRLTADAAGIPVLAGPAEATSVGNLIAQAIASGELGSLEECRELVRRSMPACEFIPDAEATAVWAETIERFKALP